jgi:polyhydroxyalkanoate synthesis regulator phasin
MKEMCRTLIQYANKIGMEVVGTLNLDEHKKYMDDLRVLHERQAKEAEEAQQAKLLRGATAAATEKGGKK